MGGIADLQVEWAVVSCLKAMLEKPPKTKFNVTQSFAVFAAIVLWTKQRAWVVGQQAFTPADQAAKAFRVALKDVSIVDAPWSLSRSVPKLTPTETNPVCLPEINADFVNMSAEDFIKWLRDVLAHGDGRTISPLHKLSKKGDKTLLAGFRITFPPNRGADRSLTVSLYHDDLRRIGGVLAEAFCHKLSGGDDLFERAAGIQSVKEAA